MPTNQTYDLFNQERPFLADASADYINNNEEVKKQNPKKLLIVPHGKPLKYAIPLNEWRA